MIRISEPVVAVVTPAWNLAGFIAKTVDGVTSQFHMRFVYEVIDDASTDGTFEIARRAAGNDVRVRVVQQTRRMGVAAGRNRGIELAIQHSLDIYGKTPDYFAFLDGDDLVYPRTYEFVVGVMEIAAPSVIGAMWGGLRIQSENNQEVSRVWLQPGLIDVGDALFRDRYPGTASAWLIRSSAIGDIRFQGGLIEDFRFFVDVLADGPDRKMQSLPFGLFTKLYRLDSASGPVTRNREEVFAAIHDLRTEPRFRHLAKDPSLIGVLKGMIVRAGNQCPDIVPKLEMSIALLGTNPDGAVPRLANPAAAAKIVGSPVVLPVSGSALQRSAGQSLQ